MVVKNRKHVTSPIAFKSLAVGGGGVGGWSELDNNATLSSAKSLSVRTSVAIPKPLAMYHCTTQYTYFARTKVFIYLWFLPNRIHFPA